MTISLQTLNNGDTNYVGKHNSNYNQIQTAVNNLLTALSASPAINLNSVLMGLLGSTPVVLGGTTSYAATTSGNVLTIAGGYAWQPNQGTVVSKLTPTNIDFTLVSAGTWYITLGPDGSPSLQSVINNALYSVVWTGAFGTITLLAGHVPGGQIGGNSLQAMVIAAGVVTLAMMSNLPANTIIGNNTGSAATPVALTAAQTATLLGCELTANKGAANGYASLDSSSKVPTAQMPTTWGAGGDLTGNYPSPTVGANKITLAKMAALAATSVIGNASGSSATPVAVPIGSALGVASLDGSGKVPIAQIPASVIGAMSYQGTWNASTNTPTLVSSTGTKGFFYKVSVAGTTSIDGIASWNVGDSIVFDGTTWDKIDGIANEVLSVAGRTGVVTLSSSDVSGVEAQANKGVASGYAGLDGTGKVPVGQLPAWVTSLAGTANQVSVSGSTGAVTLSLPQNLVVPTPASGTAFSVTGASLTSAAIFNGTDLATIALNSSATTNRSLILFEQAGAVKGRLGAEGTNSMLSDAANSDMCLAAAGGAIRLGQQSGATQVALSAAGNVTIAAPSSGQTLVVNGITNGTVANFVGTDVCVVQMNAAAATNKNAVAFLQAATVKARVGIDGTQAFLTDSVNGDLCLSMSGGSLRVGQNAAATQVSVSSTGNMVVAAPTGGTTTFAVTAPASGVAGGFSGTDIAVVNLNSAATTNRSAFLLQQGGSAKARIGIDGGNTLLSDSSNSDLCLTSTGGTIRLGQQAGATQVSLSATGNVTIAAPSSGAALTATGAAGIGTAVFNGTDVAVVQINSTAATNRALVNYQQAAATKARIGVDGSNAVFTDSVNGDLCVSSVGGTLRLGQYNTATQVQITTTGALLCAAAAGGVGYTTGSGGTVTQVTSRTTGVTLNTVTGAITLVSAAGSTTPTTFTVTNSSVQATDVIKLSQKSGANLYNLLVTAVAAGSFNITQFTTGGTTVEAPVINFAIMRGATS